MILFDRNVLEAGDNYSFEAEGIVRLASVVSLCSFLSVLMAASVDTQGVDRFSRFRARHFFKRCRSF